MCLSFGCWDLSGVVMGGSCFASCSSRYISAVGGTSPVLPRGDPAGKLLAPCHPSLRKEGTERAVTVALQELAWFQ